ncbi:MAG: rhomboid family intramembrane serine protease [Clostridiales bacterium]|nr:rhomboid family intramembrane serine protease [Clostridiales bacterium]
MSQNGKKLKISFNSPAVLGFTGICLIAMLLDWITGQASTRLVFSVYNSSLLDPLTYVRFFGHVFGHADWDHFLGNIMYFLILGPMLEEKYGTANTIFLVLATALITGLIQYIFFPGVMLLGASGVVFALILLASITSAKDKNIPVTFILVAGLYIGQQVYQAITVQGNISYMAHIVGGIVGAVLGFLMNHWKMNRY